MAKYIAIYDSETCELEVTKDGEVLPDVGYFNICDDSRYDSYRHGVAYRMTVEYRIEDESDESEKQIRITASTNGEKIENQSNINELISKLYEAK